MTTGFRLPSDQQHLSIVGRTGSGKTQFSVWALSQAHYTKQPYTIIDYKRDDLINSIPHLEEIDLKKPPKHPGLYVVHPVPEEDDENVEKYLLKVWQQERHGLYTDEAYAMPRYGSTSGFTRCLTQGRSKRIPMITCAQRPAWVSRFIFSEAHFMSVFHLNDRKDQQRLEGFMGIDLRNRLPEYWSRYYDVGQDKTYTLQPVPDRDTLLEIFDTRLKPQRRSL